MQIVLIETSGNQNYIFATNKLRENVGASQLTYDAGTTYVQEAISGVAGITPVVSASGKAILITDDETVARKVVSCVTLKALKDAPGLDVRGVVESSPGESIHERIKKAHCLLDQLRSRVPGPAARFQRLPVVAECATSGLPATSFDASHRAPEERGPRSCVSLAKQSATRAGLERIRQLIRGQQLDFALPRSTTELEDLGCDWLAVVHADGNGLGQVFLDFNKYIGGNDYCQTLRQFSVALDRCTEQAFCAALAVLRACGQREVLPIVPLVLGGDDLTVVIDGQQALQFTKTFLDEFERRTAANECVSSILNQATKQAKLTSCAGIAIVKPHFPFHAAYELAEGLLKRAKAFAKDPSRQRPPFSALDFHILHDASGPDLKRIRAELEVDDGKTRLIARPYATTPGVKAPQRHWDDLQRRVTAVLARGDDHRRRLPNRMLHELREGLFFGRSEAEGRLGLVRERYRNRPADPRVPDIDWLLVDGKLFWEEEGIHRTGLLDALDVAGLEEKRQ